MLEFFPSLATVTRPRVCCGEKPSTDTVVCERSDQQNKVSGMSKQFENAQRQDVLMKGIGIVVVYSERL